MPTNQVDFLGRERRDTASLLKYYDEMGNIEREKQQQRVKTGMNMYNLVAGITALGVRNLEKASDVSGYIDDKTVSEKSNIMKDVLGEGIGGFLSDFAGLTEYQFKDEAGKDRTIGLTPAWGIAKGAEYEQFGETISSFMSAKKKKETGDTTKRQTVNGVGNKSLYDINAGADLFDDSFDSLDWNMPMSEDRADRPRGR